MFSSVPPARFQLPDFDAPFDLRERLLAVPRGATCKGMFFQELLGHAEAVKSELGTPHAELIARRYLAFRDYSLREHMQLTSGVAPLLFPGVPLREGLRRLGWRAWPTFAESLVGRVTVGLLGREPERIFDVIPRSISLSLSPGKVDVARLGEKHFRLDLRSIYGFVDCYYVGAVEGALRHSGVEPTVRLAHHRVADATFDITWP